MNVLKKYGMKEIAIHFGMFDYTVNVAIGPKERVAEYVAWKLQDKTVLHPGFDDIEQSRGRTYFRNGWCPLIWIPRKPRTPREHATLAHEAHHAVSHLFDWVAMPRTPDNEEVAAHALAHIVNATLEA